MTKGDDLNQFRWEQMEKQFNSFKSDIKEDLSTIINKVDSFSKALTDHILEEPNIYVTRREHEKNMTDISDLKKEMLGHRDTLIKYGVYAGIVISVIGIVAEGLVLYFTSHH